MTIAEEKIQELSAASCGEQIEGTRANAPASQNESSPQSSEESSEWEDFCRAGN